MSGDIILGECVLYISVGQHYIDGKSVGGHQEYKQMTLEIPMGDDY